MAENTRVRIELDIEQYLKTQSERVLGKPPSQVTTGDLTTLTNRMLYEHKQAHQLMSLIPITRILNWITNLNSNNKVVALPSVIQQPGLEQVDDFSFDAELADMFDKEAA